MGFAIQHGFRLGKLEVYPRYREIGGPAGLFDLGQDAFSVLVALAERFPDPATAEDLQGALGERDPDHSSDAHDRVSRALDELTSRLAAVRDSAGLVEITEEGYRLTVPPQPVEAVADYAAGYDPYFVDDDDYPLDQAVGGHGTSHTRGTLSGSGRSEDRNAKKTTGARGDAVGLRHLRVFVSSPGDVREERAIVRDVLGRLKHEIRGVATIEPVFWEEEPLLATDSFQAQILRPSDCDVMVAILWSRLGTPLPVDITRPDGSRYESGTEFEFEDAVQGFREHGRPQLLVYRKTSAASVTLDDERSLLQRVEQKKKLDAFVDQWFGSQEDGSLRGAFHAFESPEQFEHLVEEHLRKIVRRMLPETEAYARLGLDDDEKASASVISRAIRDLRERRVFRVIFGYPVFAWVVLQVADVLANFMGVEARHFQPLLAILIGGYPLAVFLSWLLQVTREGLVIHPSHKNAQGKVIPLRPLAGGLVAGAMAVAIGIWSHAFLQRSPIADCERTIAVLPFENFSPSPEDNYVGRGLAEEVLHLLTKIADLRVASRTAAFSLDTTDLSMKEIGMQLGVCNILEGSVRREGDKLRITAQLIDTTSGYHQWSDTYDRQIEDIFNVYDDIASAVVRALKLNFDKDAKQILALRPTMSIDAYDLYLQGRSILGRADDEARVMRADQLFERALKFDPDFARAWAGRCESSVTLHEFSRATKWVAAAEQYCQEALERDASLIDVRVSLARLLILTGRDDDAMVQLERAKSAEPDNADVWRSLGFLYSRRGNAASAENAYHRALELAPGDLRIYQELGTFYFDSGRLAESEATFRDMVEVSQGSSAAYTGLGSALLLQGRFDESAAAFREAITNEPNARTYTNAGTAYFHQGRFEDATIMMREAVELSPEDYRLVGNLADAVMRIPGGVDEALSLYERAATLAEDLLAVHLDDVYAVSMLAHFYAKLGRFADAEAAIQEAEELGPDQFYVHYFAGLAWLELGNKDAALSSLYRAAQLGYPRELLVSDPQLYPGLSSAEVNRLFEDPVSPR